LGRNAELLRLARIEANQEAACTMSIVVTGATGHLGRLTVQALLARGVDPAIITATGRNSERLADVATLGVRTALADFDDVGSLKQAFEGADKVLLVSGTDLGSRAAQHANVIDVARTAGVGFIAYTSAPHADTTALLLAVEHRATEELIEASGLPHAFLRNGWYVENYTDQLTTTLEHGVVLGSAGDGRVSVAPRSDYAEAAAAVLATDGHDGQVYELGGDESVTLSDIASAIAAAAGQPVTYQDVSAAAHLEVLLGAGLPAVVAEILVDADRAIAAGELEVTTGDLSRLIGHPTVPMATAVADAVGARRSQR